MRDKKPGYRDLGKVFGIRIRADWTFPAAAVFAVIFLGYEVRYLSSLIGWVLVFEVLHSLSRVLAAKCCRLRVYRIDISLVTPDYKMQIPGTISKAITISSARIVTHFVLLIVEVICLSIFGTPVDGFEADLVVTFTLLNSIMLLFFLIPWEFTNGEVTDILAIYRLLRYSPVPIADMHSQFQLVPAENSPVFPPATSLLTMPHLIPEGFEMGVEILNDSKTPMVFVLNVLIQFFDLDQPDAYEWMAKIHNNGGILVELPSLEKSAEVADAITSEASMQGCPLICRVVDGRKIHRR